MVEAFFHSQPFQSEGIILVPCAKPSCNKNAGLSNHSIYIHIFTVYIYIMVCLFLHRHYIHSDHKHLKLFEVKFTIHSIPNLLAPPVGNLAGLVLQPRLLGLATCVPPRSRPPWLWEPTAPGGHETVAHKAGRDMIRKTPFGNH